MKTKPPAVATDPPRLGTPVPEIPYAGEAFRDAYFGLQPGSVVVAPNQPKTDYYVMTLERRS